MWAEALKEWHDFYVLVGTAGATLLALLFVAVSLGHRFLDRRATIGDKNFREPGRRPFHERVLLICCCFIPMASVQILRHADWRSSASATRGTSRSRWSAGTADPTS